MTIRLFVLLLLLAVVLTFAWHETFRPALVKPKAKTAEAAPKEKPKPVEFSIERGGYWKKGIINSDLYYSGMPTESTFVLTPIREENWAIPTWFKVGDSEIRVYRNRYQVLSVTPTSIRLRIL